MTRFVSPVSLRSPDCSVGAVFEGDSAFCQAVADEVGGFEVFLFLEMLSDFDEYLHRFVGEAVVAARPPHLRFDEDADEAGEIDEGGGRGQCVRAG